MNQLANSSRKVNKKGMQTDGRQIGNQKQGLKLTPVFPSLSFLNSILRYAVILSSQLYFFSVIRAG